MPRRGASGEVPDWRALYESAAPQAGYFTIEEAGDAGFSAQLLRYHVEQGKLERADVRGVYRLAMFPPEEREDLVVAWLWSERKGVISHESALALHELSDALPSKIMMSVPASWARRRLRVPKHVRLHYADVPERERAWHGSVPITKPRRTIDDCIRDFVSPEFVLDAIRDARARGLITANEARDFRKRLRRKRAA